MLSYNHNTNPDPANDYSIIHTIYTAKERLTNIKTGEVSYTTGNYPMILINKNGKELGALFYRDEPGPWLNIYGIRIDQELPMLEQAEVARNMLKSLSDTVKPERPPRIGAVRVLHGSFWDELEKENLISIDAWVKRG